MAGQTQMNFTDDEYMHRVLDYAGITKASDHIKEYIQVLHNEGYRPMDAAHELKRYLGYD